MKSRTAALFILILIATTAARAVTISQWTFETPNIPPDVSNDATQTGMAPASGGGVASGVHSSAATDWSTPAGSGGSAESWSANNWALGDYWEFQLNTAGYGNIIVNWDQRSSSTGPRDFGLFYSSDGSAFTQFGGDYNLGSTFASFSRDLSAVTSLNDDSSVFLRLVVMSGTGVSGSLIGTAGTSAIDNFTVTGSEISAVPDSSPGLVGWGCALGLLAICRSRWPLAQN